MMEVQPPILDYETSGKQKKKDLQMTSSLISTTSSLASPVDSGVQLLDSESEITSVMSVSGFDAIPNLEADDSEKSEVMTKSDIVNQNVESHEDIQLPASLPNSVGSVIAKDKYSYEKSLSDEVFEPEKADPVKKVEESDLMNVSLNSYELLDYTAQNLKIVDPMHVSMSEEVSECQPLERKPENEQQDEQIVFRRQRKKKSKSDTPKKRVSFHEDILNSTKIDDIHINHGFITHEDDVSLSFFQRGFSKKPDVVKGRYSWAAEGDAPYYEKNVSERKIKSDIYIHHARFSSSSSSSSASISSSLDEEEPVQFSEEAAKTTPTNTQPKSSCLKKSKKDKKRIDTNIVEEANVRKKKSDLLDANIFGSLKNILNFSTSVPLAERGVPEGQEDIAVYSTSHDCSSFPINSTPKSFEVTPAPVKKIGNLNIELAKTNLKLTKSEGFYPNYPHQNLPSNIILCDSNVYEHKGISYSYEYDKFQKTFEQQNQKPKSSTVYQMILKELNFFRRKAKEEPEKEARDDCETLSPSLQDTKSESSTETVKSGINKYASTFRLDWSDNETISDHAENANSRHLNSPKRKINRANHYSIQPFKAESTDSDITKTLNNIKPSGSKSSLINRFLRNVTVKKMLELKTQKKKEFGRKYLSLYVNGGRPDSEKEAILCREIENEVVGGRETKKTVEASVDQVLLHKLKNEIFRDHNEALLGIFPVKSSYTTTGSHKPLLIVLTNTTLYATGFKTGNIYVNHFVLPYTELNTVLIGPNSQTIHIANYDNDMQCLVVTGCADITGDLVGCLEIAMRKDLNKPKLPAVKHLCMRDMVNLRRAICKQTAIDKDEEYFYYSVVNIQEFNSDVSETPMGPIKEGPLMFKLTDNDGRWETAYFILKAGVLYMLSSPSYKVPMKVFPLINGACQGARRIYHYPRPHTFQIIVEGKQLYLAAPDEYVASDWLQALVHAASGTYNQTEKVLTQSCSLLMTSDHILTVREALPCTLFDNPSQHKPLKGHQALSCAAISDITAFRLPSAEHSWCVLEFACREVHESSGDWILYFATNAELERFISALELLWDYQNDEGECFPLSTIPETDPLSKKCMDVYMSLRKPFAILQPI